MKSSRVRIPRGARGCVVLCMLLCGALALIGCADDGTKTPAEPQSAGSLIDYSGCKQFKGFEQTIPQDRDCIVWDYDGAGTLLLTHANAGFNCCPGEIVSDITIADSIITILENETESACRCLCLYDLRYAFEDLESGTYTISVVEPYVQDGDDPLVCTIDLSAAGSGSCCVDRGHYPWENGAAIEPSGFMIGSEGCKTTMQDGEDFADIDCLEYEYINDNVLRIKHINAGFNCCPGEISADFAFEGDFITITESESESACDCQCLFDLEYEITGLPPGIYSIRVVEPYVDPGDSPLELTADLLRVPQLRCCVDRGHYPWGEGGSESADIARLRRLRQEILNLIGVPHCTGSDQCRSIALGAKPCGGPWEYLIYSIATVDVGLLVRKVNVYNALNEVLNARYSWDSDCRAVMEPRVGCVEGVCVDLDRTR